MKNSYIVLLCAFLLSALTLCNASCGAVYDFGLSPEDIEIVVDEHNKLRWAISEGLIPGQVKGTNLKQIKYDDILAEKAQAIANTCEFPNQKTVADDRWPVGQNVYISMSTGFDREPDWFNATRSWSDGYKYYEYGGPINSKNWEYTQMVWADTEFIGCGYTFYETNEFYKYQKLYICNYGPGGNYNGQNPYLAA